MTVLLRSRALSDAALLDALVAHRGAIQTATRRPENRDRFPLGVVDILRDLGALAAPLPVEAGGLGWGTRPAGIMPLCQGLMAVGAASLAVGRIWEAHVNAVALVDRFAGPALQDQLWRDVRDGHLLALWVAPVREPVRLRRAGGGLTVVGRKAVCTAAGVATRAVVTVADEDDREQMVLVDATRVDVADGSGLELSGMRNTSTHPVSFDLHLACDQAIGAPDDYQREPDFSAGAWRTSAVTAGGLNALTEETVLQLRARNRHVDPHQSARIGQLMIRSRTAAMWAQAAAELAGQPDTPVADFTGLVGLARVAIEHACLESIALVQRSLGFASLTTGNPAEAIMRDLAIYLRQPAADEVLGEAAIHFADEVTPAP